MHPGDLFLLELQLIAHLQREALPAGQLRDDGIALDLRAHALFALDQALAHELVHRGADGVARNAQLLRKGQLRGQHLALAVLVLTDEPAQVLLDLLVERQCGMNVDDLRHIRSTSAFPQPPSGGG